MEDGQQGKPDRSSGKGLSRIGARAEMGAKYQSALEAVFAIPIGAGLGYWADRQWDLAPAGLLAGFAVGFGAFVLRVVRMRPEAQVPDEEIEKQSQDRRS